MEHRKKKAVVVKVMSFFSVSIEQIFMLFFILIFAGDQILGTYVDASLLSTGT